LTPNSGQFRAEFDPLLLDTLAQLGKTPKTAQKEGFSEVVQRLQKRARSKYVGLPLIFGLIDQDSPLVKSYWRSFWCCHNINQEDGLLDACYCKQRWCIVCNRIKTARLIGAYSPVIDSWSDPQFVTLTRRNISAEELGPEVQEMYRIFDLSRQKIKRSGEKLVALRKWECTYNVDRDDYHPHYHLVIDGKIEAEMLVEEWLKRSADRAESWSQDVRPCDEKARVEVFKYFTKLLPRKHQRPRYDALDLIFRTVKGKRLLQPLGFRRPVSDEEIDEAYRLERCTPAIKRPDDTLQWEWWQDYADWIHTDTGESLSDYHPSDNLRELVESL